MSSRVSRTACRCNSSKALCVQQAEQAAKARNLQIEQMNAQLADKYTQQREAVKAERAQLMQKHQTG